MKALALASALAVSGLCTAQEWASNLFYDFQARQTAIVATRRLTTFEDVLGKGFSVDLDAFAGMYQDGKPVGGLSLGKRFPLAKNLGGYAGFGVSTSDGKPVSVGFVLGASVKF